GRDRYIAPKQIYRMTDRQALRTDARHREAYATASLSPRFSAPGKRWYADNSREPIRDETLRDGLIPLGAVITRTGVPTTSSKPRYALTRSFAGLFDPGLHDHALAAAVLSWQRENLSPSALARIAVLRGGVVATPEGVLVTFPNGETRRLAAGPSSVIARAVVEVFARRFLAQPGVVLLSESQAKVIYRDEALVGRIGLRIDAQRHLPDLILVDIGGNDVLLVFIEVVATDGAITGARQKALLQIATDAGFGPEQVAFVTAYRDRRDSAFKRTVDALAWRSFAWFSSEPDHIIVLRDGTSQPVGLRQLLLAAGQSSKRPEG
ncbi:MAG TPA: BsuBI/PstI family type II restriction endonuclease, partial [Methylomirabilota bacterium]|nr:BsuBI/PstI family type II restriction endonuclease [Methylomirabilota bacterium]